MWVLAAAAIACIITTAAWIWNHNTSRAQKKLPPGSMGLPFIGETLALLIPSSTFDLHPFFKTRLRRYGAIFKSRIVGRAVVVSTNEEFNDFVIRQEGKLVELWYLDSFSNLFRMDGEQRVNATGMIHRYIREIPMKFLGVESLKGGLLIQLEKYINVVLEGWSRHGDVEVRDSTTKMAVKFAAKELFGYDEEESCEKISDKYVGMTEGLMSFPLDLPGFAYHRSSQNKKYVTKVLRRTFEERKKALSEEKRGGKTNTFLDYAVEDIKTNRLLPDEFHVELMFGLLYACSETVSTTLSSAFKFLADNPAVMVELSEEHQRILNARKERNAPLTWDEYKSMTFTIQVMNETLRLVNAAAGLLRKAKREIQFKEYTIPENWGIMILTLARHLNPQIFKDPLTFNPWRWKDMDPSVVSKNFTPFGGGIRLCAGAEFGKAFFATFLHVMVTKYEWKKIKGGNFVRNPVLMLKDGMHVHISRKAEADTI